MGGTLQTHSQQQRPRHFPPRNSLNAREIQFQLRGKVQDRFEIFSFLSLILEVFYSPNHYISRKIRQNPFNFKKRIHHSDHYNIMKISYIGFVYAIRYLPAGICRILKAQQNVSLAFTPRR